MYIDWALRGSVQEYNLLFIAPDETGNQNNEAELILHRCIQKTEIHIYLIRSTYFLFDANTHTYVLFTVQIKQSDFPNFGPGKHLLTFTKYAIWGMRVLSVPSINYRTVEPCILEGNSWDHLGLFPAQSRDSFKVRSGHFQTSFECLKE